jgi:parvulin-like peptidyl-prolyl isomerase
VSHSLRVALLSLLTVGSLFAGDKAAAIVNGEAITALELDAALAPLAPVSAVQKKQQRLDALNILIEDKLVRQYLRDHGPKVEPAEVIRQLAALESAQKARGKSVDDYLKEEGVTAAQVKDNLFRMLQLAKYVEAQATPERLRAYHEANRDLFDKTTVRTSHIVIRVAATASADERQKAIAKLRSIRTELGAGKLDFAAAAKAYSQCPSAPAGGDVGYIVRKFQTDETYARTAFAMKIGEVSDIVETDVGYHLIWLTDRKPGQPSRYEDVASDVRECFEAELKQNLLSELRKKARIEIK